MGKNDKGFLARGGGETRARALGTPRRRICEGGCWGNYRNFGARESSERAGGATAAADNDACTTSCV